jgi:uncharacterized membrane protein
MPLEREVSPGARAQAHAAEHERITRQLLLFARASFVLVGTLPWWLPLCRAALPALWPVWQVMDLSFVLICHRLPERCLEIADVAMPVCSRCAGIFTGLGLGALIAWPRLRLSTTRIAVVVVGVLLLADVAAQDLGLHPLWHWSRLLTGALLGYILAAALVAAIRRERAGLPR